MKPKKKAEKLQERIRAFETMVARIGQDKAKAYTCPGSRQKRGK